MVNAKTIFVTVGTTQFDDLVQAVTTQNALHWMASQGYTHLIIQHGKGPPPELPTNNFPIAVRCYQFQSTLLPDMQAADLIISHAGAGTIMESLRLNKRLVVVINTKLMDNHQLELASAMSQRKHIFVVESTQKLSDIQTWNDMQVFQPVPGELGDEYDFPYLLNSFIGFHTRQKTF